jgi:signal peptidase II
MFYLVCGAVVLADQLSKWFVVHHLHNGPLLGDLLRLTLTENTGAAFGLFPGARAPFIVISLVAAVGLAYANAVLRPGDARRIWLALILGGNLGNLVDRFRLGHVIDFLDMGIGTTRWPVYNLADVAVVAGAVGLAVLMLRSAPPEPAPGLASDAGGDAAAAEENAADAR